MTSFFPPSSIGAVSDDAIQVKAPLIWETCWGFFEISRFDLDDHHLKQTQYWKKTEQAIAARRQAIIELEATKMAWELNREIESTRPKLGKVMQVCCPDCSRNPWWWNEIATCVRCKGTCVILKTLYRDVLGPLEADRKRGG